MNYLSNDAEAALSRALAAVWVACTSFDVPALIMGDEPEYSKLHPSTCICKGTGRVNPYSKVCQKCKGEKLDIHTHPHTDDRFGPREHLLDDTGHIHHILCEQCNSTGFVGDLGAWYAQHGETRCVECNGSGEQAP